ncbi:hypothetical protein C9890_0423 [Perkinsus sp. BL_2016]|nr:hypothetical protein C9890_0423 [Perkinsus sp. BL_2016]
MLSGVFCHRIMNLVLFPLIVGSLSMLRTETVAPVSIRLEKFGSIVFQQDANYPDPMNRVALSDACPPKCILFASAHERLRRSIYDISSSSRPLRQHSFQNSRQRYLPTIARCAISRVEGGMW